MNTPTAYSNGIRNIGRENNVGAVSTHSKKLALCPSHSFEKPETQHPTDSKRQPLLDTTQHPHVDLTAEAPQTKAKQQLSSPTSTKQITLNASTAQTYELDEALKAVDTATGKLEELTVKQEKAAKDHAADKDKLESEKAELESEKAELESQKTELESRSVAKERALLAKLSEQQAQLLLQAQLLAQLEKKNAENVDNGPEAVTTSSITSSTTSPSKEMDTSVQMNGESDAELTSQQPASTQTQAVEPFVEPFRQAAEESDQHVKKRGGSEMEERDEESKRAKSNQDLAGEQAGEQAERSDENVGEEGSKRSESRQSECDEVGESKAVDEKRGWLSGWSFW